MTPAPLRILLISAAAPELARLDLEEELRALHRLGDALRPSPAARHTLEFIGGHAARLEDVRELRLRHAPQVVHFAGHGSARGRLFMRDDEGRAAPVDGETLRAALHAPGAPALSGIVLVACHSATLFEPLAPEAAWLVGMTDEIRDDYAIQFVRQFYLQLGGGAEVAFALAQADAQARFSGSRGVPALYRGARPVTLSVSPSPSAPRVRLHWAPARERAFVGRELELRALDDAWRAPETRVCLVTSEPGGGKSALVHTWLERMRASAYQGASLVYTYSFRGQGAGVPTSPVEFFWNDLAGALGLGPAGSPWQTMDAAVNALRSERALVVLDGLDAHVDAHGRFEEGSLLRPLFEALAAPGTRGLLVATVTPPIEDAHGDGVAQLPLRALSAADAERLVRAHGVKGERRAGALAETLGALGGHPLLLCAFARHVAQAHDGRVPALTPWLGGGGPHEAKLQALVREIDRRYGHASVERAVLRTLALFDGPVSVDRVAALWRDGKPHSFVEALCPAAETRAESSQLAPRGARRDQLVPRGARKDQFALVPPKALWRRAAERLVDARLVNRSRRRGQTRYELHALVRTTYVHIPARELRSAHLRLYRAGRAQAWTLAPPRRVADLETLHEVVRHGCLAGRHAEVYARVFSPLVEGRDFAGVRRFGLSGTHLALLRAFFVTPWEGPHPSLDDTGARALLKSATYALRAQGLSINRRICSRIGLFWPLAGPNSDIALASFGRTRRTCRIAGWRSWASYASGWRAR